MDAGVMVVEYVAAAARFGYVVIAVIPSSTEWLCDAHSS
jgi:hypothetical protein